MVRQHTFVESDHILSMKQSLNNVIYFNVESCYCYNIGPDYATSYLKDLGFDKYEMKYEETGHIHTITVTYFDFIWKYILEFNVTKNMHGGFSFRRVAAKAELVSNESKLKSKEKVIAEQHEDEAYQQRMLDEEMREYYGYDFYY